LPVGMAMRQRGPELLVGNEAPLVEIDQQHLSRLQPPVPTGNPIRLVSRGESVDSRWRWAISAS
jgi:hypothetical protein